MHLAKSKAGGKNRCDDQGCMSVHSFRLAKVTRPKAETISAAGSHTRGCTMIISRRVAAKGLLYAAIAGAGTVAFGQDYGRAMDLISKVQNDLQRAADFTRNNEKERERYHNVQNHLSEFDRELRKGHFDKDKLDGAI